MAGDIEMRHYVDVRFAELKDYFCVRHDALANVVSLSKENLDKSIYDLTKSIDVVSNAQSMQSGRASQKSVYIGYAIAFSALVVSVLTLILK